MRNEGRAMKYQKIWAMNCAIGILGISIASVGVWIGYFLGAVLCALGSGIAVGAVARHPLVSGILGFAAGGISGYFCYEYVGGVIGILLGAIIGASLGGILGKWSNKKKARIDRALEGASAVLEKNQKKTLKMNKEIESMMNVSGPYIKNTKWYRKEYKYIQERLKEVHYNPHNPHSMDNASTSYRIIRGDLNRLKHSINKYLDIGKGSIRKSGSGVKKDSDDKGYSDSVFMALDPKRYSETFGKVVPRKTNGNVESEELLVFNEETVYKDEAQKEKWIKRSTGYIRSLKRRIGHAVRPEMKRAVSGYKLEELVNSGSFADVYFGKDRDGSSIVVKVPTIEKGKKWNLLTMAEFKSDTKKWKDLDHENIVNLKKSGFSPAPYVAMERVEGGDLGGLMKAHTFSMDEAIHIIGQLLKGLSYAHKKDVIHRDLKPENILFDVKGTAKISDWSLDSFLISLNPNKILENKRRLAYYAPEQLRPKEFRKPEKTTNIFRLGVIFYEILTKKTPFYDDDEKIIRSNIINKEPLPPSDLNPEVPKELDSIIMRSLEKQKSMRWNSAEEMYKKLSELMND